jgi:hypothetical protein
VRSTVEDAARLLQRQTEDVTLDPGLLVLPTDTGLVVCPVFQFVGNQPSPGLDQVIAALGDMFTAWTAAGWFQTGNTELGGRTPTQALREHDLPAVLALAREIRSHDA